MRFKKLQTNLLLLFLVLSLVPLLLTSIFYLVQTYTSYTNDQQAKQHEIEQTVLRQIEQEELALQNLAAVLSSEQDLLNIVTAPTRDDMTAQMKILYERLAKEHELTVVEIGDVSGNVLIRGHAPEQFGDNKKELHSIQQALAGNSSSGIERGATGLSVRAFVPIEQNGQVIATLQIGVGDLFLQHIEQALQGIDVHLVQNDHTIIRSTNKQMVGKVVDVSAALQGTITRDKNDTTFRSDLPIYDPSEQNIVAALRVEQNIVAAQESFRSLILTSVSIFTFTLLISTAIAIYYSHSVTKPIIFNATIARHIADKDLCHTVDIPKRRDELGQLTGSILTLKNDLGNTLHTVQHSAISLLEKSVHLDVATNDIANGTTNVAEAMNTIAHGAEQQTSHITTITEHMYSFTNDLTETAEESRKLQQLTVDAQTQSSEGAQFMHDAQMKMQHMERLMQRSVNDLHALQQQSTHISSFVAIIENVASETNLLALNASIEAARAGEHGKGFAIVADEVRKLAEQTSQSVDEITTLVYGIQQSTNTLQQSLQHGADETSATAHALQLTATSFASIDTLITQISRFVNDVQQQFTTMTGTSSAIQQSLEQMTGFTQETSAGIEETSATMQETSATMVQISSAAEQLAQLSQQLEEVVRQYKLPPM
ncbi:methyl-accepting chemotaxis protein [Caryophanon latum]|uniref:Methyl-accepting transducer domain-containing protein n=1 Tax=Caryophanon latum TaxID=33977 RepID=A0A1C0Z208_9BACL|nr:methyl-accepting chemotaxis protein [Caryophanon latum]OCS93452.1 hypothetical protein A6K76_05290 [Caryophanon latum]